MALMAALVFLALILPALANTGDYGIATNSSENTATPTAAPATATPAPTATARAHSHFSAGYAVSDLSAELVPDRSSLQSYNG